MRNHLARAGAFARRALAALSGGRAASRVTARPAAPAPESLESRELPAVMSPTYALFRPRGTAAPLATSGPTGMSPSAIRHAYGFDQISFAGGTVAGDGSGTTIAIVDAYDDPNIVGDLHQFDQRFGLPDPTFTKVNEYGGSAMPSPNGGWVGEIALDVEWAHAIAPKANILLVEANSASDTDLFQAVRYAAGAPGVVSVSMSWACGEYGGETSADSSTFVTPAGHGGVTFVASAGDSGAPAVYPSASPHVLSVGGTTLSLDGSANIAGEWAWGGGGGGVSSYEAQPSYQRGIVTQSMSRRTTPDVSYDSNPSTGFPVYDSYNNGTAAPWVQYGGTSDAAPQWAALLAIADQGRALNGLGSLDGPTQTLPMLYALGVSGFHDVTGGTTTGSPREAAGLGYDLATGLGTPRANLIVAGLSRPGAATSWGGWAQVTGASPASSPVVANQANGVHELAVIGPDGGLWIKFADGQGNSTGWSGVGGACVSITATTNGAGLVDVFASFTNGQVWEFAHNASGFSWIDLGGSATGPIAAATEAGGAEQVCSVGSDGGLWVRWVDAWGHSTGWSDAGGAVKSVAASRNGAGLVDAFAVFSDGTLWEFAHHTPGAFNWVQLGGSLAGPIAVGLQADGVEQVAAVGQDGGLWLRWLDSTGNMTGWADVGGGRLQSVAVATNSAGLVDAFGTLSDGTVVEFAHGSPQSFSWVSSLNGYVAGLVATADSLGREVLLGVGLDGSLWTRTQTSAGTW